MDYKEYRELSWKDIMRRLEKIVFDYRDNIYGWVVALRGCDAYHISKLHKKFYTKFIRGKFSHLGVETWENGILQLDKAIIKALYKEREQMIERGVFDHWKSHVCAALIVLDEFDGEIREIAYFLRESLDDYLSPNTLKSISNPLKEIQTIVKKALSNDKHE